MNIKKLLLISMLCFLPSLNYAAQWTVGGNIRQESGYNDNIGMSKDQQGSFWYKIIPVLNFSHKTDKSNIVASASYGTQQYLSVSQLNSPLQDYGVNADYKTERSFWAIELNRRFAPSFNTASTYSGNFSSNSKMTLTTINPSVSYRLTELDSLNFLANYSQMTYTGTDFRNNTMWSANLNWQRRWTERFSNSLNLSYMMFKSTTQKTDSYNLNIGMNYLLSEKWTISGSAGGRLTNFENNSSIDIVKSQSTGYLLNASVNYNGEKLSTQFSFSRSLMPSSQGSLQEQDNLNFNMNYQMSEKISVSLNTSYLQSNGGMATKDNNQNNSRQYIAVQPALDWHISPDWRISASYGYRNQEVSDNQSYGLGNGISNIFMLSINYNCAGLSLSR